MPRIQRAGVLGRSWWGQWRAAGLTLLSSCSAGGVPGLNRSAWSADPDYSQMPQQRNSGQLQPPQKAVVADPLTACLDANGTYICTAYNPRCYIIQKVRLGVKDKLPYVTTTMLFADCSAQCQCLTSLLGLLPASLEVHLSFSCGVRSRYTQKLFLPPPSLLFCWSIRAILDRYQLEPGGARGTSEGTRGMGAFVPYGSNNYSAQH